MILLLEGRGGFYGNILEMPSILINVSTAGEHFGNWKKTPIRNIKSQFSIPHCLLMLI